MLVKQDGSALSESMSFNLEIYFLKSITTFKGLHLQKYKKNSIYIIRLSVNTILILLYEVV